MAGSNVEIYQSFPATLPYLLLAEFFQFNHLFIEFGHQPERLVAV